jgi:hypothetical protein
MCAINISVATSRFSLCYLYSGMRKKCGALLSEQPTYESDLALTLTNRENFTKYISISEDTYVTPVTPK